MITSLKAIAQNLRDDYRYRNIFITIIAITIIPVIMINIFFHVYSVDRFKQTYVDAKTAELDQIVISSEELVKHINYISTILSKDNNILDFLINPNVDDYQKVTAITQQLINFVTSDEAIHSIYIYSRIPGIVISSNNGISQIQNFYDTGWISDFDTHYLGLYNVPTRTLVNDSKKSLQIISFLRNLPFGSWGKTGCIVINIDEQKYRLKYLSGNENSFHGFIINNEGEVISHANPWHIGEKYLNTITSKEIYTDHPELSLQVINGKPHFIITKIGSYTKWSYSSEVDIKELEGSLRTFLLFTMFLLFTIIILIIILDIRLSKMFYLPHKLLGDIRQNLEQAKPLIGGKVLLNLIHNRYSSEKDIHQDLHIIHMDFTNPYTLCMVIEIDKYQRMLLDTNLQNLADMKKEVVYLVQKILDEQNYTFLCSLIRKDNIGVIINLSSNTSFYNYEMIASLSRRIIEQVKDVIGISVTIGVGSLYEKLININLSYTEAIEAVSYKLFKGDGSVIFFHETSMNNQSNVNYISEYEKSIINDITFSNVPEVTRHVKALCEEMKNLSNVGLIEVREVFTRLIHALLKLLHDIPSETEYPSKNLLKEFQELDTIDEIELWLVGVCSEFALSKRANSSALLGVTIKNILSYIDENIANKNISLTDIGDAVGLSPSYVSRLFKDHFGYNYLEYVNRSRVKRAKELLLQDVLSVSEIGNKIGFASTQSFLRVFQRYEGLTPGKYRNLQLERIVYEKES